jgi:hypothetical protein
VNAVDAAGDVEPADYTVDRLGRITAREGRGSYDYVNGESGAERREWVLAASVATDGIDHAVTALALATAASNHADAEGADLP